MIGLYVEHNTIRAVDIVKKSHGYILNAISEQSVQLPLPERVRPLSNEESDEFLDAFYGSLQKLLSVKGIISNQIALAIDIQNAFIHTVPFGGDFSPDNVKRLIEWELSQYFPDIPSSGFLFDTYNPGFNPARDLSPKFIYTAVLKSYIHLIQRSIRSTDMKLLSINVDQFAVENVIRLAAGDKKRERLNTICFRRDNILFCSLLWNHRLVRFREYTLDENNTPGNRIERFLASLSGSQKNIDQRIYYYPADETIIEETEKNTGWTFEHFKPFENLQITRKAKRYLPESVYKQEGFTPAVAVALKGD